MFHFLAILYIFLILKLDHLTITLISVEMNSFATEIGNAMLVFIYKTQEVMAIAIIKLLSFIASRNKLNNCFQNVIFLIIA